MTTILVDFSSVFHIRWHTNPTFAVDAAIAAIRRLTDNYEHVIVCCDSYPTWRHELYAPYKANRGEKDPALYASLDRATALLRTEFTVVAIANYEADDVIASLALRFREESEDVVIYTSDKDLMQLVGPACQILSTKNDLLFDGEACRLKFGVLPERMGDFLSLCGDASDNVPGVRGVGSTRAAALLKDHGSIEGVIKAAKDPKSALTPKLREALVAADADGSLATSRVLVSLVTDIAIDLDSFAPVATTGIKGAVALLDETESALEATGGPVPKDMVYGESDPPPAPQRETEMIRVPKHLEFLPGGPPPGTPHEDGKGGVWSEEGEAAGIEQALDDFNEQKDKQAAKAQPEANPPPKQQERKPMSRFQFKKATREKAKLRMAVVGPAGSGKTMSALAVARHLGERIVIIDTERGSASKYAGTKHEGEPLEFDVLDDLESFAPGVFVEAIRAAETEGYDVIIIDSLSHAWMGKDGALEQVDNAARKQHGNSFGAWRDVTPQHNALVDAIIGSKAHIIATMRTKTEFSQEKDDRGKTVVKKIGLAPVQRDGLDYEFDVVGEIDAEHCMFVSKSRCAEIDQQRFRKPGSALADALKNWLSTGVERPPPRDFATELEACTTLETLEAVAKEIKAEPRINEETHAALKRTYVKKHKALVAAAPKNETPNEEQKVA